MLKGLRFFPILVMAVLAAGVREGGAVTVNVETGVAGAGYNDVQVPKGTGTRFSLTEDFTTDSSVFYRVRLTREVAKDSFVSLLYAPLTLNAGGVAGSAVRFNNDTFPAGTRVSGTYRFDSYRASYWRSFKRSEVFTWKLGFTANIRDAAITLSGNGIASVKNNTGFVPLLNFGLTYAFNDKISFVLDGDAIAGGPGRAEDVLLAGEYRTSDRSRVQLGYRFIEGGADVDEVYNFALINFLALGFVYSF